MGCIIQNISTPYLALTSNHAISAKPPKKKYPLPKGQYTTSTIVLKKVIRFLRGEKNLLAEEIKKIAKEQEIVPKKTEKVIEALNSIDYSSLKKDLRRIVNNMSDEERKTLLVQALREDFKKEQKFLGNQCINLMTLEHLRNLAKDATQEFVDVQTTAAELNEIVQTIKKYDVEEARVRLLKNSKQFILFRIISNFIHRLATAFNLLEIGREPNTYFETKYMLDIYWRLLEIPLTIIKFIFKAVVNPFISAAIIAIAAVIGAVAIDIFKKIFNKCPQQLPHCKNLTAEMKNGTLKPVFGRENELNEVLEAFAANNEIGRKHPLIVGEPGVGKTELMKGLAWRLAHDDVPEPLKGKKIQLFYSVGIKKDPMGFELKDPLQQIMHKVDDHQKELILVFDEAQDTINTLGDRFNSILDTSPNSLFYAIGITTFDYYKEKIETTPLDRRFKKIFMEEADQKQTRSILRNMNHQLAPDIKVSQKVLDHIFITTNEKIPQRRQPDKAVFIMSQAFEKVRHLQNGGSHDKKMQELTALKEDLASKLSRKQLHGISIKSPSIKKIVGDSDENTDAINLKNVNKKIEKRLRKIQKIQKNAEAYTHLKKLREWHEKWLYDTNGKILQETMKGRKINDFLEKLYLFNNFVLIPELDQYLADFVKEQKFNVAVTKEMIDEIVDKLAQQENFAEKLTTEEA